MSEKKSRTRILVTSVVALFFASGLEAAKAQSDGGDQYRGKTVELLIGLSAGGGYDAYGRMLARYIGRHIPGQPRIVARNMPGAGSLVLSDAA